MNHLEQCALAAAGQLPEHERAQFDAHIVTCAECREKLGSYQRVSHLLAAVAGTRARTKLPIGLSTLRPAVSPVALFPTNGRVASNHSTNRLFSSLPQRRLVRWTITSAAITIAAFFMGILVAKYSHFAFLTRAVPKAPYHTVRPNQGPVEPSSTGILTENERLKVGLTGAVERAKAASDKLKANQAQLAAARMREAELEAHIRTLQDSSDRLAAQSTQRESEYEEIQRQLNQVRREKESLHAASLVEETELANLRTQVTRLNNEIERQAYAKATNAPCQSLNARNLHVVDVHDTEGDGTMSRAFGRVFYVEGKCLTFYAFDLPDKTLKKTFSFYVWGARGDAKPIRKLGIFHRDDPRDGRWLLTFDDPAVLGQINNVFVTMEPDAVAATPKGKTILKAYLGNDAKHP